MSLVSKLLGINTGNVGSIKQTALRPQTFKNEGYVINVPKYTAPKVGDTVPTVGDDGQPLLAGYYVPGRIFDSNKCFC